MARWLRDHDAHLEADQPTLARAIQWLLAEERLRGILIEHRPGSDVHQSGILGVGLSGFVRFADPVALAQSAQPTPFLLPRLILQSGSSKPPPLLGRREIGVANAGAGLELVAHLMLGNWDLAHPLWRSVAILSHEAYVRDHRGYHIRRAWQEDWKREPDIYIAAGYRRHAAADLPVTTSGIGLRRRHLYVAEASEVASQAPGSSVSFALQYRRPRCRFTEAEQKVLLAALDGLTDEEAAAQLGVSLNTVKSQWRSLYQRVGENAPDILPDQSSDGCDVRGREKRRNVLAYVGRYPEELRPYAWPPDRS